MAMGNQDLEMLAGLADTLVNELLKQDDIRVSAVDATNPNAVSLLCSKGAGVPLPDRLRVLLGHALIFGVVPSDHGTWVTFFPAEKEAIKLETNAQGGE